MTLLICPFDNLVANILLEIFISMLITLHVTAIELVVVANEAVIVVLVVKKR